jgi:glycosyltransferase involved in cell wall biosynthesis
MRILHISTRLILGGSQENTVLSCEGQARRGHEVHLAFGPIYGPEGSLLERVEKFSADVRLITGSFLDAAAGVGVKVRQSGGVGPIQTHVVPHMVREVNPFTEYLAFRELYILIRKLQPDVVHTHSSKAGVIGRAAAWTVRRDCPRRPGPPVAWPSPEALYVAGGDQFVAGGGDFKWAKHRCLPAIVHTIHGPPFMPVEGSVIQRAKVRLNNWIYTRAEKYAAKRCHVIASVADAMTEQFLGRGIGKPEQYVTVRSGMETDPYLNAKAGEDRISMRQRLGFVDADFVIGTVARLAQHKGHDDLLEALGDDLKRDRRLKLVWVGDGWWRERLTARAESTGLKIAELDRDYNVVKGNVSDASVVLTGLVSPQQIPGLMRSMDVLAHPSSREGLPRTVPQALLAGTCPVAYDCDGTGEVCIDMQTGRLVKTGDVKGLGDAIRWVRAHPSKARAMVERGREMCAREFSAETMIDNLEKVYQLALERAGASADAAAPEPTRPG